MDLAKSSLIDLEAPAGATGRKQAQAVQRERLSERTPEKVMRQSDLPYNAQLKWERKPEAVSRLARGHKSNRMYGYHGAVHFKAGTGLNDGALGQPVALNAAGGDWTLETYLSSTVTTKTVVFPCAFLMSAYSSWTSSTVKAFIKCL